MSESILSLASDLAVIQENAAIELSRGNVVRKTVSSVSGLTVTCTDGTKATRLRGAVLNVNDEVYLVNVTGNPRKPGWVVVGAEGLDTDVSAELAAIDAAVERVDPGVLGEEYQSVAILGGEPTNTDPITYPLSWFGATKNNPVFDNISALNAATLAVANLGGGEVYVPKGTWWIAPTAASWIQCRSNVHIRLDPGAVIKVKADAGDYPYIFSGVTPSTLVENITISGGTIDHNVAGNTTCNIAIGNANSHQNTIRFESFRGITVKSLVIDGSGVNQIVLNGAGSEGVIVRDVTCYWRQGTTTTPNYDNTVIYVQVKRGCGIFDNRGYADVGECAGAFVEAHGSSLVVDNNESDGFFALCYPTSETSALNTQPLSNITISNNRAYRANYGIGAWSFTGYTIRGLKIIDNILHISQLTHDQVLSYGIALNENVNITGDFEDIEISRNLIVFEAGDTRTVTAGAVALNFNLQAGIAICPYGNVKGIRVADNTIRNAPAYGLKIGRFSDATYSINGLRASNNTIIDAGRNPNATAATRTAIALLGTLVNVDIDRTTIRDTGPSAMNGNYYAQLSAGLTAGTNVKVRNTQTSTVSGAFTAPGINRAKVSDEYLYITVTFPSIATLGIGTNTTTITVMGAKTTDVVIAQQLGNLQAGLIPIYARCSSANTITIGLYNSTAGALTPTAVAWAVRVISGQII